MTKDARSLAASGKDEELEILIDKDESKVSRIYPWVVDLKNSDIPNVEIAKAMIDTENVAWMEDVDDRDYAQDYAWREKPELKETPQSLGHCSRECVHNLPQLRELLRKLLSRHHEPEPISPATNTDTPDIFSLREQAVFKHCGIGGVLHPKLSIKNDLGSVSFQGDCVSIMYGLKVYSQPSSWWTDTPFDHPQQHYRWNQWLLDTLSRELFRNVGPWLGEPAAWQQSAVDNATLFSGRLDLYWGASPFSFFYQPSEQEIWNPELLRYCVGILKELLAAMEELNKLNGCCNSFPIFVKMGSSDRLVAVEIAFESISRFARLLSEPLATTDKPESVLQNRTWRSDVCNWTLGTFRDLFGSENEAVFFLYQSTRIDGIAPYILHMAALHAQVFSVGLATFCRGHCSEFSTPHISRTVEKFRLLGAAPTGPSVIAERVELSCLGDMLHRPVWMFCLDGKCLTGTTGPNRFNPIAASPRRYDVQARLSQIFDIWGASIVFSDKEEPRSFKLWMMGGFLSENTASSSSPSSPDLMLHWSAVDSDRAFPASCLELDRQVVIGAVTANPKCTLKDGHREDALTGGLVDLRVHPGGWKTVARAGGANASLGGGPMAPAGVGVSGSLTQQRFDPTFMKGSQVQQWNRVPHDLTVLNAPWGLELSLCTGVARRVPLRALLNDRVVSYLQSKINATSSAQTQDKVKAWTVWQFLSLLLSFLQPATPSDAASNAQQLDRNAIARIQQAVSNEEAAAAWTELGRHDPAQLEVFTKVLETFIEATQCARVDDNKNLLLWWPEPNGSSDRGVKLDRSWYKGKSWIPILEDTESCAIFGLATCDCLECLGDGDTRRPCQKHRKPSQALWALRKKQLILHTGIAATKTDTSHLNLACGDRLLLNSYKAERHVVQVREMANGGAPCILEYRGVWSRPAIMMHNTRFKDMPKVLESSEYLSTGIPVLILHRGL
ncbi:hypothetical protein Trco_005240 [Trichoderma cornu-damae]|uniref:Uncharacterized protein n=1 Tax=Trichoderma cornu-damae TaxID=654480 RepID=A0A9P8QPE5_9HYPO|nr:hypothetical protein Trco_005240 [Trichoderma cornu-damae]